MSSAAPLSSAASPLPIIPAPLSVERRAGAFSLGPKTTIVAAGRAHEAGNLLAERLELATGVPREVLAQQAGPGSIVLLLDHALDAPLGQEGYQLDVSETEVLVRAAHSPGLHYGAETLLQLMPPGAYGRSSAATPAWSVPSVRIEDRPRFAWRGAMLDVARHYYSVPFLYRFIDTLAMHKMNVLHLHLTDDQGWRLEIKKYPRLTSVGARRARTIVGHALQNPADSDFDPSRDEYDDTPHGGFYTQDEMRSIVAYAANRHITVVPEIEMPGHAQAAIAAYPHLGCTDEPVSVSDRWGIHTTIFNPSDETIAFLQDVLREVMAVFPSRFIHVGGDEAVKDQWRHSPSVQERIRELGLGSEDELQSWFITKMDRFLAEHGRRLVGWDEILEGGLAPGAVVMSWRGEEGGVAAARDNHDVVMCPYQHTYFDYYQTADWSGEPLAFRDSVVLSSVYGYDPLPAGLPPSAAAHILGTQAQLWTEYMPDERRVEYQAFPRMAALAEVAWSVPAVKDYRGFVNRLGAYTARLAAAGVHFRPLDPATT